MLKFITGPVAANRMGFDLLFITEAAGSAMGLIVHFSPITEYMLTGGGNHKCFGGTAARTGNAFGTGSTAGCFRDHGFLVPLMIL